MTSLGEDARVGDAVAFVSGGRRYVGVVRNVDHWDVLSDEGRGTDWVRRTRLDVTTGYLRTGVWADEVLELLKGHRSADETARERGAT